MVRRGSADYQAAAAGGVSASGFRQVPTHMYHAARGEAILYYLLLPPTLVHLSVRCHILTQLIYMQELIYLIMYLFRKVIIPRDRININEFLEMIRLIMAVPVCQILRPGLASTWRCAVQRRIEGGC